VLLKEKKETLNIKKLSNSVKEWYEKKCQDMD